MENCEVRLQSYTSGTLAAYTRREGWRKTPVVAQCDADRHADVWDGACVARSSLRCDAFNHI